MDAKMKELLIDYIDGNLPAELEEFVKKQLAKSEEVALAYQQLKELSGLMSSSADLEPDSTLRDDFLLEIEKELEQVEKAIESDKVTVIGWTVSWKVAAAVALLAVSFFAGRWVVQQDARNKELAQLKVELEQTKELVLSSLQNKTSASTRLYGINAAYESENADAEIIRVLIKTMNEDENVNVRLAAVQALSQFSDQPGVVNALVQALEMQKEALVQIALINLMVELKERRALEKLERIIRDKSTLEAVKDEAHMAVFKLS